LFSFESGLESSLDAAAVGVAAEEVTAVDGAVEALRTGIRTSEGAREREEEEAEDAFEMPLGVGRSPGVNGGGDRGTCTDFPFFRSCS